MKILMFGIGMFAFLMTWNRFSIFLLKKRISTLENKLGIKTDKYGDECEQNGPEPFPFLQVEFNQYVHKPRRPMTFISNAREYW